MPSELYTQPKNLAFHNLCVANKLPSGTRQLLGLNLKFCFATSHVQSGINQTVLRMARSIRTMYFLKQNGIGGNDSYDKQIYIQNKQWHPPPAPLNIEEKITEFEKILKAKQLQLIKKHKNLNLTNLTPQQRTVLNQLQCNHEVVIKPTDKNLGPAAMDVESYIRQILKEHLLTNAYKQLTLTEATERMESIKSTLKIIISANQDKLSSTEATYFQRSFKSNHRLPILYGLPKVHKTPITLRPVVSSVNSFLSIFSNWLDFRMKQLLPYVKSHIKNSIDVIKDLKNLNLPKNALLFSADAKSMYTNIDTATGIQSVKEFIQCNQDFIPADFPSSLFLQVLQTVMENNIFSFENTTWLQLSGTAMGTPVACAYATISYGQHENSKILPSFEAQLLYYRRYIDDIFGIWVPPEFEPENKWKEFKEALNNWSGLEWVIEEPSKTTVFLDLNLRIQQSKILTNTYQKPLNLYLYIPPRSAHPPSCLKGLISGEVRRYWLQNSPEDFEKILVKFIERLVDRGHSLQNLAPIFMNAASTLDNKTNIVQSPLNSNILYIHWTFHPHGLQ